jgi:PAS domain S-box-containing protein
LGTLTGKVLLVVGLIGVVVGVVLVALLVNLGEVDRARGARARSDAIVKDSHRTQQAVLDMETGLRGYGLTHDQAFLAPWRHGRAAFVSEFAQLYGLTGADSSGDDHLVAQIGRQGRAYIREYGDPIVQHGMARAQVAGTLVDGKRRVDELRVLFDRLISVNNAQASRSFARASALTARTRAIALTGLLSTLLLLAGAAWYLVRRVSWPIRRVARAADTLSDGGLSARAPEQGPGEVYQLGRSFNSMASSIQAGAETVQAQNTALAEARAEAQRTADELTAQQELAVDLIATAGFDGYFHRLNPAWERTLGWSKAELCACPFIDFVHPEDRESTEAEAAKLTGAGTDTISFANRYRTKEGSYRWLEWNVRPVAEQELLYAVARDVTDRRVAEEEIRAARDEADRANLAKSEFLSRMSHELRTPLNAILGFGQLLAMDGLQGHNAESVEQILSAGGHLLSLIDEVLDISRIEAGTMRMSVEPVDVISALADAVALIGPVAAQQGIKVSYEPQDVGDCYVSADRQRLRQVVLNLLSNAVKYNRPGGSARVAFDCDEGRGRITVSDTGPGIPGEQLERLFVAFDRLGAEGGEIQGTGLGLALSRSLVEQMGGTLTVDSTLGTGSVFTVELNTAADPVDAQRLAGARLAGESSEQVGPSSILYIEDNPSNSKLVEQAFASQPAVHLIAAMLGSAGLELARAHQPDLILLDLHLPDLDGSEVLRRLRADESTATIPVIVLSADATMRQIRALLAAGAGAYLTKPLDIPEFLAVVNEHLPRKEIAS